MVAGLIVLAEDGSHTERGRIWEEHNMTVTVGELYS